MENKEYIYNLIVLEYNGGLDMQLKEELQSWRELSYENYTDYKGLSDLLSLSDRLVSMKKIEVGRDLIQVRKRINPGMKYRVWLLNFQRVAAILIFPLLIYTFWSISGTKENSIKNIVMKSTETAFGVRSQINLSDGTKVWMNSGSKLSYPEEFVGGTREVKLIGEAYFQIKSDIDHPFYVDLYGCKIKATGTSFNISNYSGDKEIYTYLEHGNVSVLIGKEEDQNEPIQLRENEIIILKKAPKQYKIQNSDGSKYLGWIKGLLILRNDSINDVVDRLGRWYNAEIFFDDKLSKSEYVFTATFKQESLEEAMKLLSYSTPITYKIISGTKLKDSSFSKRKVIITKK